MRAALLLDAVRSRTFTSRTFYLNDQLMLKFTRYAARGAAARWLAEAKTDAARRAAEARRKAEAALQRRRGGGRARRNAARGGGAGAVS